MMRMNRMMTLATGAVLAMMAPLLAAQARSTATQPAAVQAVVPTENLGVTQERLLSLLRVSPTLTSVVAADPALLANNEYVARSNPELAQFLTQHPEITRNPAFYLFSKLREQGQKPYDVLTPREGFERHSYETRSQLEIISNEFGPFFAITCLLGGTVWLLRLLMENRRWGKMFGLQSQVHGKLIDKFGTSQELMAYMQTEAGRRFLEAAPIATESAQQRMPNAISRVLLTTQIGIVATLLGIGLIFLRNHVGDAGTAMLVLGIVVLMPGIGFLISAAITWELGKRLGLMPGGGASASDTAERP